MKKRKQLAALAMAAILAAGGNGISAKAASASGVLRLPSTKASAEGNGSVEWTADLSLSTYYATATMKAKQSARLYVRIQGIYKDIFGLKFKTDSKLGSGTANATATVNCNITQEMVGTKAVYEVESSHVKTLTEGVWID